MIEELWDDFIEFTAKFVVPDWGALVSLLPVCLAIPVFLYITWSDLQVGDRRPDAQRQAAPARRSRRPAIHMPGPTFAPIVGGGRHVPAGVRARRGRDLALRSVRVALVLTLLYWGREAMRDYDHIPAGAGRAGRGRRCCPRPPARRPRASTSRRPRSARSSSRSRSTILVFGLIVGGWLILVGFGAIVITGIGWLLDARKEYLAVERADRTGHIETGRRAAMAQGHVRRADRAGRRRPRVSHRAAAELPDRRGGRAERRAPPAAARAPAPASGGAASVPAADVTIIAARASTVHDDSGHGARRRAVHARVRQPGHACPTTS